MKGQRVLIVDDHPALASGLRGALASADFETSIARLDAVVEDAEIFRPDVVIMDLDLGRGPDDGLELIPPIVELRSTVVVLTGSGSPVLLGRALQAGARAVMSKSEGLDGVVQLITTVLKGQDPMAPDVRAEFIDAARADAEERAPLDQLTDRERQILGGLVEGSSAEEMAEQHCVSLSTIRNQIQAVLSKLGVHSQLGAVAYARRVDFHTD